MSPRLPKCPICGTEVQKNVPPKKLGGKTYHLSCYLESMKEKNEIKLNQTDIDSEKTKLFNYITILFKIAQVSAKIEKQVELYCVQYNATYKEIQFALYYFFELMSNPVTGDGIGIIPYILQESREYLTVKEKSCIINNEEIKKDEWRKALTDINVVKFKSGNTKVKMIDIENL